MKSYLLHIITIAILILYAEITPAAVYTCIDGNGKKIFQGTPCEDAKQIDKKFNSNEKEQIVIDRERREEEERKLKEKARQDIFWETYNLKKRKVRSLWKPITNEDPLFSELLKKTGEKLKKSLKDPSSFVLEEFYTPYKIHAAGTLMYQFDITYRAKNSFGGYIRETQRVSILVSSDAYRISFSEPNEPAPEPFTVFFPDSIINIPNPEETEKSIPSNKSERVEF